MLRTCTPGPAPHLRSPSPVEGIRRQIVDMVRVGDHRDERGSATIIYDLRKRQGFQRDATPNKPHNIRRLPARVKHEESESQELNTSKSSGSFPQPCKTSTPNINRKEWQRAPAVRNVSPVKTKNVIHTPSPPRQSPGSLETSKRARTGHRQRGLRTKSIRLQNDTSPGPHCQCSDSSSPSDEKTISKTSGEICEIRGSAISASPTRQRIMTPVKRAEVQRRSNLFSASLEIFRRRLKMNQSKFFSCKKVNPEEYVVRKDDDKKLSAKLNVKMQCVPTHEKTASPSRVAQTQPETHADERGVPEKTRYSYRLPDVAEDVQELTWGDVRALPQVHTYVLEDNSSDKARRHSFKEPAPLTSHNLNIHNMFMDQQRRRPRVEANGVAYDARVYRWVEETNAHSRVQRVVRFNISPNSSTERMAVSDSSRVVSSSDRSRD